MCMLPSNGQKINLKVREIINMEEKRKKQSSAAQICILYFIYIILILFCEILDTLSLGPQTAN